MKSRRRILAASLAALVALGFGMILLVLRYGRPLYYSDGTAGRAGAGLSQASMLEFGEAQVLTELRGEVVGRVASLPDGRWIYGQRTSEGDVDLVVQDPKRPGLPPENLEDLNSDGVDFAPAMGPGPSLYFASDRAGGEGGMDLYRCDWREGSFGPARALRSGINSPADESDPAPAPRGPHEGAIAFVRQDPGAADSRLCLADLLGSEGPEVMFPQWSEPAYRSLLRDPIFGPDGRSLYFVRRSRQGVSLLRTASHQEGFLEPWSPAGLSDLDTWRSPLPGPKGLSLTLLRNGKPALLYRCEAEERLVYWEGQRQLEHLLLTGLLTSVLLVILITLGGRWSQLDLITKLLLLSLLIHGLVLLVMSRVDILTRDEESPGEHGAIEVEILSQDPNESAGGGRMEFEPVKEIAFEPTQTQLRVDGPESEIAEAASAERDVPVIEMPSVASEVLAVERTVPAMSDAAHAPKPQSVTEDLAGLEAPKQAVPEQARMARSVDEATPDARENGVLSVEVPRSAPMAGQGRSARRSPGVAMSELSAQPTSAAVSGVAMSDAPQTPGPRSVAETRSDWTVKVDRLAEPSGVTRGAEPDRPKASVTGGLTVEIPGTSAGSSTSSSTGSSRDTERRHASSTALPDDGLSASPSGLESPVAIRDARSVSERARAAAPKGMAVEEADRLTGEVSPLTAPGQPGPVAASTGSPARSERSSAGRGSRLPSLEAPGSALAQPGRRRRAPRGRVQAESAVHDSSVLVAAEIDIEDDGRSRGHGTAKRPSGHGSNREPKPEAASALQAEHLSAITPAGGSLSRSERSTGKVDSTRLTEAHKLGALPSPGTALARASRRRHDSLEVREDPQPGVFRNRFGTARIEALRRFGGTKETEAAVRDGLAYLARVQKDDGSWGNKGKIDRKYGETFVGKTGLCLLAFLGAGHVPGKRHVHSKVARSAMEFLLYVQDEETGHFGLSSAYSHGIATYALAECYALTKDPRLRAPLEAAVVWILENQNASRDRSQDGGWGYYSPTLRREDAYARTSVSSWQIMALLSAQKAGLKVPAGALLRARRFFANNYDRRRGYFLYSREPSRLRSRWRTLPASTPASVFSLLLLGEKPASPRVEGGLTFTLARRPQRYRWRGDDAFVKEAEGNTYFWYYGSLACFLAGGKTWKQWNQSLAAVLPRAQQKDGSFKPLGPYAAYAGDDQRDRSYTTAMCVLSLEVYYRYFTPLLQGR